MSYVITSQGRTFLSYIERNHPPHSGLIRQVLDAVNRAGTLPEADLLKRFKSQDITEARKFLSDLVALGALEVK